MASLVAYPSHFLTPSSWLTSGADANFPATNLALYSHPWRPAKSSGNVSSGSTWFGADFGSAVSFAAVAIDNINISAIKIQAASSSNFVTGLLETTVITVGQNLVEALPNYPMSGRYKELQFIAITPIGVNTRRYWRVLAATSTRVPGWDSATDTGTAGPLTIGSILWISGMETFSNALSTYDETPLEATIVNDNFAGGGAEPVIVGSPYASITLGATPASRTMDRANHLQALRHGIGRYFLYIKETTDHAEWYVCRRAADVSVRQTGPNSITVDGFVLQTAV